MNNTNILLDTDSYKFSHWKQYPPKTSVVHSYVESRGGKFPKTVFFGLQPYLKDVLTRPITQEMIDEADAFVTAHIGPGIFNRAGFEYIINKHNGYFPVSIKAVPEGSVIDTHNVLLTIENTDPECFWLPSYLETAILRAVWYGTTVASLSYSIKQTIVKYLARTGDENLLPFKLHDFGARGVSSFESAGIGGAAHLINFMGTDNVTGIVYAQQYYDTKDMLGFSIPAAEHSTMTSWGGREGESLAMENMLDQFASEGKLLACVSDSYDIYDAIVSIWGTKLKKKILKSGATLVVRPDSGDPVEVTLECVKLLAAKFGTCINSKGYKVLHPSVRLIQGDGIDDITVEKILENFQKHGFSADNIAFGCGGGLLQKVDRDTQKFAMKCSAIEVDGEWRDVFKDPVTDKGKQSKKGQLMLYKTKEGKYFTDRSYTEDNHDYNFDIKYGPVPALEIVFENGKVIKEYTFQEVRDNSLRNS